MTALQGRVRHRPARLIGPHAPCPKNALASLLAGPSSPANNQAPERGIVGLAPLKILQNVETNAQGETIKRLYPHVSSLKLATCAPRRGVRAPQSNSLLAPFAESEMLGQHFWFRTSERAFSRSARSLSIPWPVAHPDFRNRSPRKVSSMIEQLHQADCQSKYSYAGGFASIALPLTSWLISLTESNHSNPNQLTGPAPFSPWVCPSRSRKELAERESPVHP